MRQFELEEPKVIPSKLRFITLIVHRIARAFLEKKDHQARPEQFDEFIFRSRSTVRNVPKKIEQRGKIVCNRLVKPKDQVAFLLSVSVAVFFLFPPGFLLTCPAGVSTVLMTACALRLFHGEAPSLVQEFHHVAEYNMSMCSDTAVIFQKNSRKKTSHPQISSLPL
jgi:hypothetical protein